MEDPPELFVCGLLHDSELPIFIGTAAFSRATLSSSNCLFSVKRPGPQYPRCGMAWAYAAIGSRTNTASATIRRHRDGSRIPSALRSRVLGHPANLKGYRLRRDLASYMKAGSVRPRSMACECVRMGMKQPLIDQANATPAEDGVRTVSKSRPWNSPTTPMIADPAVASGGPC